MNAGEFARVPEWLTDAIAEQKSTSSHEVLSQIVGGVPKGRRNDAACILIGTMLKRFSQSEWDTVVRPLVLAWNKQSPLPLSEHELLTKYKHLSEKEAQQQMHSMGSAPSSKPAQQSAPQKLPPALTLRELYEMDIPPVQWDIEGLFEHGTPNMLSAAPNNFKTWLVDAIAISVASGEKLFGHFSTLQQGVLIVSEEDGIGITKNRFTMLLDKSKKNLPIHLHIQKGFKLTVEIVEQLLLQAKELRVKFVILDSLRAVHLADENSSQEMQKVMDLLMRFSREGITILFTHHHRKKTRGFGATQDTVGEDSRGSTSINAAVHGHITCEHKEIDGKDKLIITQPKLKCAAKLKPFVVDISFNVNGDIQAFEYEGDYDDDTREQVKRAILLLLKSSTTWLSKRDLANAIKVSEKTIQNRLRELELERKVMGEPRSNLEKRGVPLSYADGSHQEKFYKTRGVEHNTPQDDDDF